MATKKTPAPMRSFQKGTLHLEELRALVDELTPSTFAGNSVQKVTRRLLALARDEDLGPQDLCVHDGDLHVDGDLSMLPTRKPGTSLLIVRGDLHVSGLLSTRLDPDTVLLVTGDVFTDRLLNEGFLQVHGSLTVKHEALWLDNDACAEIRGNVRAELAYTQYQAVKIGGSLEASLALGDANRFKASTNHPFVIETDEKHKEMLKARLPRAALEIEGDPDDWCIDAIDTEVLRKLIRKGTRILRS